MCHKFMDTLSRAGQTRCGLNPAHLIAFALISAMILKMPNKDSMLTCALRRPSRLPFNSQERLKAGAVSSRCG